jgi:hypothetical protein
LKQISNFIIYKKQFHTLKKSKFSLKSLAVICLAFTLIGGYQIINSSAATLPTTYYLSPSGSDRNTGTSSTAPWQTITKLNSVTLLTGDKVLFQGGQTFSGKVTLIDEDHGTAAEPITFSSYGTGRATINGGNNEAFDAYNTYGIKIDNLNFAGSGRTTNSKNGISFYNDLAGNVKLSFVHINNVDVSGFGDNGINVGGWNNISGFNDVRITNANSHDNGKGGISTYGQLKGAITNVYVGYSKGYNNTGIATATTNTGSGIVLGNVDGGIVEYSLAYNNGALCNANECAAGIWTYDSNNIVIQHNESYNNKTGSGVDGDGFDLDQNVSNSIVQYNYSHGNDGHGYLLSTVLNGGEHQNNHIRYNISENDDRKVYGGGAITLWGNITSDHVYNNTIYISPNGVGPTNAVTASYRPGELKTGQTFFRNNIFITSSTSKFIDNSMAPTGTPNLVFQQNDYYTPDSSIKIKWAGTTYTSLSSWRAATGQEKNGSADTGLTLNPQLNNPGTGGTVGNAASLTNLSAYKLLGTSPLINKGLNLNSFSISPGNIDYYGNSLPQGNGFDFGAHEVESSAIAKTGDLNSDNSINIFDLSILLTNYGKTSLQSSNPACDLNSDGNINIFDLSILLSLYGS